MATLNIKDFPDLLYRRLEQRAGRNRRSVAQEVVQLLDEAMPDPPRMSLLDLEGLGKEQWDEALSGSDAAEFISDERNTWS